MAQNMCCGELCCKNKNENNNKTDKNKESCGFRGILSMAWCPNDPDLLLSCAKDNRILCWNPNTQAQMGEVM